MVMLEFERISINLIEKYNHYYDLCIEKGADTTFINLWAWDSKYQTEIAFKDELCWLRFKQDNGYIYGPPLGNWQNINWQEVIISNLGKNIRFKSIPEFLMKKWQNSFGSQINIIEDRDNWEYLYKISDLISLTGEKYRNQRKLSNQFLRNNNYRLVEIEEDNILHIKNFQHKWFEKKELEFNNLTQENEAINRILCGWKFFKHKIFGYGLWVEDELVGYTIGEKQDNEHIIIHIEKALSTVRGSYPAINKLTLEKNKTYKYVNREQDLGLIGLRKSKEEYNPIGFVKKYQLVLQGD